MEKKVIKVKPYFVYLKCDPKFHLERIKERSS